MSICEKCVNTKCIVPKDDPVDSCPEFIDNKCKEKMEVYSRIVGYMRPVSNWNKGKQEEFKMRKSFNLKKAIEEE